MKATFLSLATIIHRCAVSILLLFTVFSVDAQVPNFRSAKTLGQTNEESGGVLVCPDSQGNLFLAGTFGPSITLGTNVFTGTNHDVFLVKLDPQHNVLWAKHGGGSSLEFIGGLQVDSQGNSYFAISTVSPDGFFDGGALASGSTAVAKYNPDGQRSWLRKFAAVEAQNGLAVDANGNCYLAAQTNDVAGATNGNTGRFLLVKMDSSGAVVWQKVEGPSVSYFGIRAMNDSAGNIIGAGSFSTETSFGNRTLTSGGGFDIFIAKYGPLGALVWATNRATAGDEFILGLATDAANNIYLTSHKGPSGNTIEKLSPSGNLLWSVPENELYRPVLSVDRANNVFVIGTDGGWSGGAGWLRQLNGQGQTVWSKTFALPGDAQNGLQYIGAPAFDSNGRIYLTGRFLGDCQFDGFEISSARSANNMWLETAFVAKLAIDPLLQSRREGSQLVLSWSTNETTAVLESTPTLGSSWSPITNVPAFAIDSYVLTNDISDPQQFFRLRDTAP